MVEVSEKIKELLKEDSTYKEFIVHFPNGERADLTNSDVVSESVSFTESLSSQQYLQFGLTEASVIEFETVGVENIVGYEIECSYDVYSHEMVGAQLYLSGNTGEETADRDSAYDETGIFIDMGDSYDRVFNIDGGECYVYCGNTDGEDSIKIPAFTNTIFLGDFCIIDNGVITKSNVSDQDTELWIEKIKNGLCDDVYMLVDGEYVPVGKVVYNIIGYDDLLIIGANDDYTYSKFEDVYTKEGSVPLGRFIVDSCPRNHEDMTHRIITAYSVQNKGKLTGVMQHSMESATHGYKNLTYNAEAIARALINNTDDLTIVDSKVGASTAGQTVVIDKSLAKAVIGIRRKLNSSDYYTVYIGFGYDGVGSTSAGVHTTTQSYVKVNDSYDDSVIQSLAETLVQRYSETYSGLFELNQDLFEQAVELFIAAASRTYLDSVDYYRGVEDRELLPVPYEYADYLQRVVQITLFDDADDTGTYWLNLPDPMYDLYSYQNPSSVSVSITSTSESGTGQNIAYGYTNAFDPAKFLNGWLELNALYGNQQRDGSYRLVTLNKDNPIEIGRSMIKSLWWNEYDIQPIGSIKYKFKSGSEENTTIYQFGNGKSVYDMTNNYVLQHLDGATAASVNLLLDSLFIPNIGGIAFTPVELSMKGLPYIEDGDFLQIIVKDETEIMESFIEQSYQGYVAMFELPSTELSVYESKIQQVKVDEVIVTDYSVHAEQTAEDSFTLVIAITGYTSGTVTLLYGEREIVETYVMNHTITGIQALSDSIESNGGEIIESEVI